MDEARIMAMRDGGHILDKHGQNNTIPALLDALEVSQAEVARLREIVRESWRLWADTASDHPPVTDRGFVMLRVHPERYAAFDALFRSSIALEARSE